jgi:Fe-S cluster assembly protein SufD
VRTMNQQHNAVDAFARHFQDLEAARHPTTYSPLIAMRRAAMERFRALGFPTQRHEDWRYTNLHAVTATDYACAPADGNCDDAAAPAPLEYREPNAPSCVFVNGCFQERLSAAYGVPGGVIISSLAEALRRQPEDVFAHLDRCGSGKRDVFAELNTAFIRDGAFIRIPRNTTFSQTIHIHFHSTAAAAPMASHPRVLVVAEDGSDVNIVVSFTGEEEGTYLSNSVLEFSLGDGARVHCHRMQQEASGGQHISNLFVTQGRASVFHDSAFLLGSRLTRNSIAVTLNGEGAETMLGGLSLIRDEQTMDTFSMIDHAVPRCSSRELYKSVIDGKGRGVFTGRISVRKDAQQTDARQSNNNLLLSDDASIDTRPQLEILADDVKCTHGATVGRLDDTAIFYLRSRGIGREEARDILTWAFAGDIIAEVGPAPLREYLDSTVHTFLRG